MARFTQGAIFVVGALCLLFLPAVVFSQESPKFQVQGRIYCDVCRANFVNKFSVPMPGAKVKLECRKGDTEKTTYTVEGETDREGFYQLTAVGDHEKELCEVTLVKSGRSDCNEFPDEGFAVKPASAITLTQNNGFQDTVRHANPLSFNAKKALPMCVQLFSELDADNKLDQ